MAEQLMDLIIKRLDRIEEKQDRTLEQTTKTNGRVTRLEQGYDTLCDDVNSLSSLLIIKSNNCSAIAIEFLKLFFHRCFYALPPCILPASFLRLPVELMCMNKPG